MAGVVSSTEDQVSWFFSVFFHFAANFQSIQIQMLLSSSISTFPLLLFLFIFGFKFLWQWETKTWFSELVLRVWVVPSSWHLPPLVAQTLRHIGPRAPWRAHLGVATLGRENILCWFISCVVLSRKEWNYKGNWKCSLKNLLCHSRPSHRLLAFTPSVRWTIPEKKSVNLIRQLHI